MEDLCGGSFCRYSIFNSPSSTKCCPTSIFEGFKGY
eukprot:gene3880-13945_t